MATLQLIHAVCSFPECGRLSRSRGLRGLCGGHYRQSWLGKELRLLVADRDPVAYFDARVDRSAGPNACWPWVGARVPSGYGTGTHRIAWILAHGEIPEGEGYHGICVLHHCDNPPCCNPGPGHLFLGTNADNRADCAEKGRTARGDRHGTHTHPESRARGDRSGARLHPESRRGEKNGSAKLTAINVIEIRARAASGESKMALARVFSVSDTVIRSIVRRETWAHVSEAEVAP